MDGCDRAISHISPKIMQRKRVYIMDILAGLMRLQMMSENGEEEVREDDVRRWKVGSGVTKRKIDSPQRTDHL